MRLYLEFRGKLEFFILSPSEPSEQIKTEKERY